MWVEPNCRRPNEWKREILELKEYEEYGYIFQRDFDYPNELHNKHKGLPLAPDDYKKRLCITLLGKKVINN